MDALVQSIAGMSYLGFSFGSVLAVIFWVGFLLGVFFSLSKYTTWL